MELRVTKPSWNLFLMKCIVIFNWTRKFKKNWMGKLFQWIPTEWANCFSGFLQGMSDLWPSNCLILIEKKTPCKSLWQMAGFGVLGGVTLFFFPLGNSWHLPNDILPFFINCHSHCGKNFPLPKGVKCIWTLSNVLSMKNPHH